MLIQCTLRCSGRTITCAAGSHWIKPRFARYSIGWGLYVGPFWLDYFNHNRAVVDLSQSA